MLNLNIQLGRNPLHKHRPIFCKIYSELEMPFKLTVGEDGEIVAWDAQSLKPIYYMMPSLNGDHGKCVSFIVTPLRMVNQEEKTYKIVTYHWDGRVRVWELRDGACISISPQNMFADKIVGIIENQYECRFFFPFSETTLFIFDSWTMKVVGQLEPKRQVYSHFLKGQINENKEMELYDNYHKSYRLNVSALFSEGFFDVGKSINSLPKATRELQEEIEKLLEEKLIQVHKVWKNEDWKETLSEIVENQKRLELQRELSENIFNPRFLENLVDRPQFERILPRPEAITYENIFFIKGLQLWYFIGTSDGRVLGFPATKNKGQSYQILTNAHEQFEDPSEKLGNETAALRKKSVNYLNLFENFLIVSWEDGTFSVFGLQNLKYMLEQQEIKHIHRETLLGQSMKKQSNESQQETEKPSQNTYAQEDLKAPFRHEIRAFDLNTLQLHSLKLSSSIKYWLAIKKPQNQAENEGQQEFQENQELCFQLQNSEVVIYNHSRRRMNHFVGIRENCKIYCVIDFPGDEYIGVATEDGIEVYGSWGYERRIEYEHWQWSDYGFFRQHSVQSDYNNFSLSDSTGLELIEYANRNLTHQIQYGPQNIESLLYETFGAIETNSFPNDMYSKFHFVDKKELLKSLHSASKDSHLLVLKHKHNSYRRDLSANTSFLLNASLSRELEDFSSESTALEETIEKKFTMFSCFLWDLYNIPFLSSHMRNSEQIFSLKRRCVHQGIGKTFTLYFDSECVFNLSKFLVTEYAIATISFFQTYALKELNDKTDEMVEAMEYFTLIRATEEIYISGEVLSKSVISPNQNIVKASINLLISTIIAGHLDIHPLYEYFILNLKNIQEGREKAVSATECSWLLYLGLGIMYGKQPVEKQQVKMLIGRILDCIELSNFVNAPDLVLVLLKLFNEGLNWWKNLFLNRERVTRVLLDLFRVFFLYDGVAFIPAEDKKFNFCFEHHSPAHIKKMKQAIVKTVICLSKEFNSEFIQCLTSETVSQKVHVAYPASVVEILRQFLKSERPNQYLVFFVELLLQCLSPMTPNLRKYVQKNVISTLQFMCSYKSISFNQASQKLSVMTAHHLYIYCLRTSTKWRTISLKEKQASVREDACLEMSPKGTYIALLSEKLYIWRLSSGFWSGVLGAFSQGWTFEASGNGLCWEDNEHSITVLNSETLQNTVFKL